MSGLTDEQRELYDKLQNAITDRGNVAKILQGASRDDLRAVLIDTSKNYETVEGYQSYTITLLGSVIYNSDQKNIEAILGKAKDEGILKEVLNTPNITIKKFESDISTLTPLAFAIHLRDRKRIETVLNAAKEHNVLKEVWAGEELFCREKIKTILQKAEDRDMLDKILQVEKDTENEAKVDDNQLVSLTLKEENDDISQPSTDFDDKSTAKTTNKPIIIGSVCSVIAALAVGVGCGVAGIQLPILVIAGIAVAAAVLVGLVAYSITCAVSSKLEETNAQGQHKDQPVK
ncbi:hypothetical protein GO685_03635 [Wolbachia endosymbiont of Madathamugadia hiepei]|uniref:hypothetical protein n=1 Tax=Wolbachia endosymbiont of Madathamugadia hiepei TaxID=1241303 RepID=UPI00158E87D5|nr:hypothetical protein [Wolbachia endosymbiont of Madathamugadia hiepei]NUX01574.1 hypothetical protein [Wolbachia endosymbiont of Madathamugadia hiepei]